MEVDGLRRAYDAVLAEVDAGGFGPPPPERYSAEQVVAHLVASDELMREATEAVLAGSPYAFYDLDEVHRPELDELAAECGGLDGLAARLRATSDQLVALVAQLGAAADTPVETHLREGFELVIDEPLPWGRTIDLHTRVHLPRHLNELRALRRRP
ncbi:DinB family protein [Verrucosispora sp. WMMD703]|uniref:DinB family protein n=1 Tax=unclassified Micromonospora TaxID=2617518 RepID=UPI00249C20CC|nr:DinB family protein [Verrucosispora sp. WMMD1129]WFE44791.1 DinB family protein [Verrucosispora sp. WMMD1129]